jgi:hypothetical protein
VAGTNKRAKVFRQAWAAQLIARRETLFRHTNQGEHAWRAYQLARDAQLPIPAWVLDYLDAAAKPLAAGPSAKEAMRVLRLASGKRGGRHRSADTADRHLGIVQQVGLELSRGELTESALKSIDACQRIAGDKRATPQQRKAAVEKIRALLNAPTQKNSPDLKIFERVGERVGLQGPSVRNIWYAWTSRTP